MIRARFKCFVIFLFAAFLFLPNGYAASQENLKKASDLNDKAIVEIKSGNLNGAEVDLLAALEYSDQYPNVQKNLGVVYYEKGVHALREGNFLEAEKYLKSALNIDAKDEHYLKAYTNALFLEADTRVKNGQDEEAFRLYEKAARQDERNSRAWTQASYYAWMTQRFDLAQEYLHRAEVIDPKDKNVAILKEKLKRSSTESTFGREASEHFILSAQQDYIKAMGSYRILDDLEQAFNEVSYLLNYSPKSKIPVVFYPEKEFHEHWKLPYRVNGFYDGKLRIPHGNNPSALNEMRPMIKHELTHAFVSSMAKSPIPQWLNEGLAQWVEGKKMEPKSKDALVIYQITRRLPDIKHLDAVFMAQKNPYNDTEMTLAYMKAFSLTEYLIQEYGLWSVMEFIKTYPPGPFNDMLFKKYFRFTSREIEEQWIRWLERKKSALISH